MFLAVSTFYLPYPYSPWIPNPISISSYSNLKVAGNPGKEQGVIDTPNEKILFNTFSPN